MFPEGIEREQWHEMWEWDHASQQLFLQQIATSPNLIAQL